MMRFNIGEEETFFDTEDSFLSEESFTVREDSDFANLSSGIWSNELKSVKERRADFLNRMGFHEDSYSGGETFDRYVTSDTDRIRECSGDTAESCCVSDLLVEDLFTCSQRETSEHPCVSEQFLRVESEVHTERCKKLWWRSFVHKMKCRKDETFLHKERVVKQMKVENKKKKCKELTALYSGQEISAHKGVIWKMKFSPDGKYLATGGEDGVLRVWGVTSTDASCISTPNLDFHSHGLKGKSSHASVIVPETILQITEKPLHELFGHKSDILDLAWSSSNKLLSASKDNTVRLWHLDSDECQSVFRHCDSVTCLQFNPMNENYFTSGSVDGKLRIWGIRQKRVVKWADVHDIITAICYRPNGNGIVTGSLSGICRFYEVSGSELLLDAERCISGKRKSGYKITGIQFLENSSQRVMVTSEDTKICILDGFDIIHKYKGPRKSGCQSSASLTPNGRHVLSVGEDSRIYIWNVNDPPIQSSKPKKSTRSCERLLSEGVSVALPWQNKDDKCHQDSCFSVGDTDQNPLSSCFSMNVSLKSSATWPEEKLPALQTPYSDEADQLCKYRNNSGTWGLVIVTAGWDGMIRTFHNFGLPTKI